MNHKNLLPFGGELYLFPGFVGQSEVVFQDLRQSVDWQQREIKMFGKCVAEPRLTAWYGDSDAHYRYSGLKLTPLAWTVSLLTLKRAVEQQLNEPFNSVLLNFYRDQNDYMGWHRDNESELGPTPIIASISLGETRKFQMRPYKKKEPKIELSLREGSLLIMKGATQENWEHRIAKQSALLGERISLTFRNVRP